MLKLNDMSAVELRETIDDAIDLLVAKKSEANYNEGYEQGRLDSIPEPVVSKPKPLIRAEVVRKAKADIEDLKSPGELFGMPWEYREFQGYGEFSEGAGTAYNSEFIVNHEKRTVVVLLRGFNSGGIMEKGIAKCAPGDCFNEHIGRAISLRRSLNLEVPSEYLNAPKPEGIEVGDVVIGGEEDDYYYTSDKKFTLLNENNEEGGFYYAEQEWYGQCKDWIEPSQIGEVIDDSARNY